MSSESLNYYQDVFNSTVHLRVNITLVLPVLNNVK
uniref:Uncharacterized protein n=1 Tax=Lepeophtheirus salmonis TaxID=72036 RepID=A0A0K2UBF8_LEPSM